MKMKFAGAAAAFALGFALQAQADTTLTYVGNPFTSSQSSAFGTSLDAVVTVNESLPDNFTGILAEPGVTGPDIYTIMSVTFTPVDSSLTPVTLTSTAIGTQSFGNELFITKGQVTSWDLGALTPQAGGLYLSTENYVSGGLLTEDTVNTYGNTYNAQNYNVGPAGTWTVVTSAAPEPTTWALMFLGIGAVGGALRMRKRQFNSLELR